ncbi:monocyte to macrophage differentiation factor isoform X1 [Phyllopteryx taeniolatus]|uniref:monocyte to macrophage differentiation factor isoform X1 n=1 Tax=Phyllopteryx taeniolatus TaxID=161469 RepID=UPI002AD39BBF|nr:monocyte to macrophage differentiation factor isoform X1 [Phyllopteryx taeniolatus]XP_061604258.1 monocyte to macrophage differentiation factor isoform X1 [Phyllopteryx taeniolatus]
MKRVISFHRFMNRRPSANCRYQPTCYEHAANCYTHAFLIAPALLGMALLHRLSATNWQCVTAWVYGLGLSALFLVSTVFHVVTWKKSHMREVEHCFHMCDRVVIYVFIAASYTPWLNLRELGPVACHMRWFVWLMAASGTFYVFNYHEKSDDAHSPQNDFNHSSSSPIHCEHYQLRCRYKVVELAFYLTMGFLPASVVTSMNTTEGFPELACGGALYCVGVFFFKSDGVIPFAHAIWHVFVALAAAVHYYAIWKYLYTPLAGDDHDALVQY